MRFLSILAFCGIAAGPGLSLAPGGAYGTGSRLEPIVRKALQQIAADLSAQYVLRYALPDDVKPDRRLNVSLKRRGVSERAPSLVPDR
jgi:hypothetical protein